MHVCTSEFCRSELWAGSSGFSAWGLKRPESRRWSGWTPIWRLLGIIHFQAHLNCWQNPVPCCRRSKVPAYLLAFSQGHSSLLEAPCIPSHMAPPSSDQNVPSSPSHSSDLSELFLLLPARENSPLLKAPVIRLCLSR